MSQADLTGGALIAFYEPDAQKVRALVKHFGCEPDDVSLNYDEYTVVGEFGLYLVLTDDEANARWEDALDACIDDYLLAEETPAWVAQYFDRDAWKRDAKHDGRGHSLSSYDGEENEVRLDDGTYMYIYRAN